MKYSAKYAGVGNRRRILPAKGLSFAAFIVVGWFLRERYRRDWRDKYVLKVNKNYYVDPANLYKYYGSYGNS